MSEAFKPGSVGMSVNPKSRTASRRPRGRGVRLHTSAHPVEGGALPAASAAPAAPASPTTVCPANRTYRFPWDHTTLAQLPHSVEFKTTAHTRAWRCLSSCRQGAAQRRIQNHRTHHTGRFPAGRCKADTRQDRCYSEKYHIHSLPVILADIEFDTETRTIAHYHHHS